MAASQTGSGVEKSGSPAAKEITSIPSPRIALALAVMLSVGEGRRRPARVESASVFNGRQYTGGQVQLRLRRRRTTRPIAPAARSVIETGSGAGAGGGMEQ